MLFFPENIITFFNRKKLTRTLWQPDTSLLVDVSWFLFLSSHFPDFAGLLIFFLVLLTQIAENRRGAEGQNLRALGDFRLKRMEKPTAAHNRSLVGSEPAAKSSDFIRNQAALSHFCYQ